MPTYHYRAFTQSGNIVSGSIAASNSAEVARRIDYLRLVPIDVVPESGGAKIRGSFNLRPRASTEDVTVFTHDLALLLKAGARLDGALDLLASDADIGKLRPVLVKVRSSVLSGESLADALSHHPSLFSAIYVALVRVGEASGALEHVLQVLGRERARAEGLRRKLVDALRYPAFVLFAAACVLIFFLSFVLPQLSGVLRDFGAKIDPIAEFFIRLSDFMRAHRDMLCLTAAIVLACALVVYRQPWLRSSVVAFLSRLPLLRVLARFRRTALFCRNLELLLTTAVPLTTALRILADIMATMGHARVWSRVTERVRQGGKLSDALDEARMLSPLAVRMLRLGEETGQLPALAGRV